MSTGTGKKNFSNKGLAHLGPVPVQYFRILPGLQVANKFSDRTIIGKSNKEP
jgi:hypothetical protein